MYNFTYSKLGTKGQPIHGKPGASSLIRLGEIRNGLLSSTWVITVKSFIPGISFGLVSRFKARPSAEECPSAPPLSTIDQWNGYRPWGQMNLQS